jgi:ubiquinol-cytochrome c reductase iron-sulfur subunit
MSSPRERHGERWAAGWLTLSMACSVLFAATFARGGQPQLEGIGLGGAFLALAAALIVWSRALIPPRTVEDPHLPLAHPATEQGDAANLIVEGSAEIVGRRVWLVRFACAAAGVLGVAGLFPIRGLGPNPNGRLGETNWRRGLRFVREDGSAVSADALEVGSVVTVFPEGAVGPDKIVDMANDAVMLVRVQENALRMPPDRTGWTPNGFVAYSKICTHAGCPVALYREGPQQLMCPCHQSTFDVTDGGTVVFGPAARSLPQLPVELDADGTLRAGGPMSGFIGPESWEHA